MAERGKCVKKKKEKRAWWRVTLIVKKCKLAIKVLSYSQLEPFCVGILHELLKLLICLFIFQIP